MFDQCLKFLIIIGLYSAVPVRGYYANYDEYATTTKSTTGLPTTTSMTETSQPTTTQRILGRDEFDLDCARDSNGSSAWWNDPSPNQSWRLFHEDDDEVILGKGGDAGYPFQYGKAGMIKGNYSFLLISPLYSRVLDKNGCFSTSVKIHTWGSVRIRLYQKPDCIALEDLIAYSDETKKDYILFEVWGDDWKHMVKEAPLKHFDSNFQLIFEGIHDDPFVYIAFGCVNITRSTNCAGNTGKSTTTMSTTTTERPMRENGN